MMMTAGGIGRWIGHIPRFVEPGASRIRGQVSRARACGKQGAGATGGCLDPRLPSGPWLVAAACLHRTGDSFPSPAVCRWRQAHTSDKAPILGGRAPATAGMNLQDALQKKMERRKKKEKVKQGQGGFKTKRWLKLHSHSVGLGLSLPRASLPCVASAEDHFGAGASCSDARGRCSWC
jgi:hypothetical protein